MNRCNESAIPLTDGLDLIDFLASQDTIGKWIMEGLPNDNLSKENGIIISASSRFPLMVDPQAQAMKWILQREKSDVPKNQWVTDLGDKYLKDKVMFCIEAGMACLLEKVENEMDPMLDPVLEKLFVQVGRQKKLKLGDADCEWDPNFRMYLVSRLSNPSWSPELYAKTTVIDFTVTVSGLAEQLLGCVIFNERKELEDQMDEIKSSIIKNQNSLKVLDEILLEKLSTAEGELVENVELIDTLNECKVKSKEVAQALESAAEKQNFINKERNLYMPVADMGSVLYFCVVDMVQIEWMYCTSLSQFMALFVESMTSSRPVKGDEEEGAQEQETSERVNDIIEALKKIV